MNSFLWMHHRDRANSERRYNQQGDAEFFPPLPRVDCRKRYKKKQAELAEKSAKAKADAEAADAILSEGTAPAQA